MQLTYLLLMMELKNVRSLKQEQINTEQFRLTKKKLKGIFRATIEVNRKTRHN